MKEQDLKVICKIRVGSHLYGTNTENSDQDFKGVYLPSKSDMLLGQHLTSIPKSIHFDTGKNGEKNTKDDIDCEYYSLQYFIHMLSKGQTCAIEMLFANEENIIKSSIEWKTLVNLRKTFITKEMKSFLGYARTQASKYSNKGDRIKAIEYSMEVLLNVMPSYAPSGIYLKNVWDILYTGNYVRKYIEPKNNCNMYEICDRKFEESASIDYVYKQLHNIKEGYGKRANQAKTDKGVDYKAVSHAFRIAYQLEELLETGDLKFPLKQSKYLTEIKTGKKKFNSSNISGVLEELLVKVEKLTADSLFPESVDMEGLKEFVIEIYNNKSNHNILNKRSIKDD